MKSPLTTYIGWTIELSLLTYAGDLLKKFFNHSLIFSKYRVWRIMCTKISWNQNPP